MSRRAGAPAVTFGVLGPVQAIGAAGPVPLRGPRHRAVLARLLVARGQVVSVDRLVGDLWETPPEQAVAAVRTFVADLRRALEPERAPRQPARLLVTAPPGYALRADPEAVDAWRFETAVTEAGRLIGDGYAGSALARLTDALACWRGPAYAEFADQGWARAEVTRLDELRMLAVERRGEALLALGRAAEAAVELEQHAAAQPLREDAWRLWATALYGSGRQGEALAALRRARETLVAELGLDPGPGLRRLEADILAQAPHLDPVPPVNRADVGPPPGEVPAAAPTVGGMAAEAPRTFVGRREEQELLGAAAAAV
ncbi:BTAD domain-containing putative transcriptional regulator, partial [Micromonospora purpureochromogenes]|uniref:AfsR/SARP family transcriptional regulator n=1 Tax=Micromonospora purpureochromogenes TaxID=47872 RepID=UPI0033264DD2